MVVDIVYPVLSSVALISILVICLLVSVFGVPAQWDRSCVVPLSFDGGPCLRSYIWRVL